MSTSPDFIALEETLRRGGGPAATQRQHEKGRLTARERIEKLIDPGTPFFELGLWAAYGMYKEWGGAVSAGVVTGIGTVDGRRVMVIANDATVKAGAFFPMTCKKVLRAQRIALENRLPLAYLVDSAGVFLPASGRSVSRRRRLRPHLPQQRRHLAPTASRSSPRSWATASPAAATCPCSATNCS